MSYLELHCHSNFSFLDGASHPEELAERAAALGYPALALTDHSGLYGIIRFAQACRQHSIKPIAGAEITLDDGHHLTLLARDALGYRNLSSMLSKALSACAKGECKISYDLLRAHAERLIVFSGCDRSEIATLLLADKYAAARTRAGELRELFGRNNFYLELIHHRLPTHDRIVTSLERLGQEFHIPRVVTNNAHYAVKADRKLQDVLTCIRTHSRLDEAEGILYPNGERYLKSDRQMRNLFARFPEALENSAAIGAECEFSLDFLMTMLPDFPVPDGHTVHSYLRKLSYEGARVRYGDLTEAITAQLEHELDLIIRLNLSGYFLIVWDIVRFCREQGILCQGRGSAANSAICYSLAITSVDPIRLKLLFERFLSEGRKEPPDIDIDIAHARREEVIQYVYDKYGRTHAGMVANVICYRARSAVRDVGKTLGFSLDDCNRLSKLLDHYRGGEDLAVRLQEAGLDTNSHRIKLLLELVGRIRTFPRHLGIHVGGMVITQSPLTDIVPIENATMPNRTVVQWDKDDCADARLVKIDLLGLGELTCIDLAFRLIKQQAGISLDMAKLTYDDPKVFDYICKAETVGVFQIESRAQMSTLPRMKPRTFYDIVVEVAIIRPGPIQGDMVHPYLRRRNGEEEVTYPHPKLIPVLERTLGVPLFQEQGMQLVMLAAGFSASDADELRRAMGHKRSHERMAALYDRIVTGMVANGYAEEVAIKIFKQLAAFADFGFAESHAASFALLVYVSAWIKLYYPTEFYCALLNAQPMGFYSPSSIIFEAKRRSIRFLPVDITSSEWDCTVENTAVRIGFRYVGSLGDAAKEKIKAALMTGRFVSVADFVHRTGLSEEAARQIAKVGAFNKVGRSRRDSLWDVLAASREDPKAPSLFPEPPGAIPFPAMTKKEKLSTDYSVMGLTTGPHPMSLIRATLQKQGILSSADTRRTSHGTLVRVAGMVIIRQQPETAKGIIFATLEDEFGFINLVVKPTFKKKYRDAFLYSTCLLVKGQLERKGSVINIVGLEFSPLNFQETKIAMKSRNFH